MFLEFGWEVFIHAPKSSDPVAKDYQLLLSIVNDSAGEELALRETCNYRLSPFSDINDEEGCYEVVTLP